YRPGARSRGWVKVKLEQSQEFVVGGFTQTRKSREHIGALLLGYYDQEEKLAYAGHVGKRFSSESLRTLRSQLGGLERVRSPFSVPVASNEPATWLKPEVVVEVRFNEWTSEGRLRHPVFLGVRDDKDAREVTRDAPTPVLERGGTIRKAAVRGAAARSGKSVGAREGTGAR